MISVGFARNDQGTPVMREKAYPTSEQIFSEKAPPIVEEDRKAGIIAFYDGDHGWEDHPRRRYSHSSSDL